MPIASRQVVVTNKNGLHARPAMKFADTANTFKCAVAVEKTGDDPLTVDGKSIMGLMTLAAEEGTTLIIHADGSDAETALAALAALFTEHFVEGY